jgi:hypothetical protein
VGPPGTLFAGVVAVYAAARIALEPARETARAPAVLHSSMALFALLLAAAGTVLSTR